MMDIPHCDGLPFLVAQGVEAANHFQGESFGTKEIEQILRDMRREKEKYPHRHAWCRETTVGKGNR